MATDSSILDGKSTDRGVWQATGHGVVKSRTRLRAKQLGAQCIVQGQRA